MTRAQTAAGGARGPRLRRGEPAGAGPGAVFAVKVAHPRQVRQEDVDELRGQGWSDAAISDAIQVITYFNYMNRVADAVGIDGEPEWTTHDDPA